MPDTTPAPIAEAAPPPSPAVSRPVRPGVAAMLLGAVILLWGANWPVMKVGVEMIPPMSFAAARLIIGAISLFAVAAALGQLRVPSRRDRPLVLSVSLLPMAGFLVCVTVALQYVPAGRSAILAYTTPLWVVPLALIFLGERLNAKKAAGLALGLGGIAVLFNPFGFDWRDGDVLMGNGLLMLAALLWAVSIVQIRGHKWEGTPLSLAPWQLTLAGLVVAPVAFVVEGGTSIVWSWELIAILAYAGLIATGLCYWAVVTVNRALPAITMSLGTLGTPVVGLVASALWLGEAVTATNAAGLTLIAVGLALVALAERKP